MNRVIDCSRLDLDSYEQFLRAKYSPRYEVNGRVVTVDDSTIDVDLLKTLQENESHLWDYQRFIVSLAIQKRRFAIFADAGLGKSLSALAWIRRILPTIGEKKVLIVSPLMVLPQWLSEERKFYGTNLIADVHNIDIEKWANDFAGPQIGITNIDKFHEKREFNGNVAAVVFDESSAIKDATSKTRTAMVESFRGVPWKLCLTATPAPNDREEYANHAAFLEYVRSNNEFYARFFINRDNGWEIKPHGLEAFYRYLASWSVFIRHPERYGFSDNLSTLPQPTIEVVNVPWTEEQKALLGSKTRTLDGETKVADAMTKRQRYLQLSKGFIKDASGSKRVPSNKPRVCVDLVRKHNEPTIVWCMFNEEEKILLEAFREAGICAIGLSGATDEEERTVIIEDFRAGKYGVVVSKPRLMGFGLNLPFATVQIFNGTTDSWESVYQSIKRSHRYGATKAPHIYFPITQAESVILDNVMQKKDTFEKDSEKQEEAFVTSLKNEVDSFFGRPFKTESQDGLEKAQVKEGENFTLYRADSIKKLRELPPESVDFAVFSPPFASLFTYSNETADMGNSGDGNDEFNLHFEFFLQGLHQAMRPGRIVCCHLQQIANLKFRDGFVGLKDFRGVVIELFQKSGFNYFAEWVIPRSPQLQAIKEKVRSLAFAQLESDRLGSKPGLSDFILVFKKPGEAEIKVNDSTGPSRDEWIEWACGVWTGIPESNTLNIRGTKDEDDVKHVCPMNLEQIRRCVRMYSSPGEVVMDPFNGIGSSGVVSLELGRKYVGIELKQEYFDESVKNLTKAELVGGNLNASNLKKAMKTDLRNTRLNF